MIRLLTKREALLKKDQFLGFVGKWPSEFRGPLDGKRPKFKRIVFAEPRWVHRNDGIMNAASATLPFTYDPATDANGFNPQTSDVVYEVRWGVPPHLLFYIRWPSGSTYRGGLQAPGNSPNPADAVDRYTGAWTYEQSPLEDPRLEMIFIKDQLPDFQVQQNTSQRFVKMLYHVIVNVLRVESVDDASLITRLENRQIPWKAVPHWSEFPV